jgi:cation diffusion facilitator CzcD-associated flavoprotein CzcO
MDYMLTSGSVVVCATGFDTTFTPHFKVIGRNGSEIHKQFGDFPVAYLAVTAQNFPNFFCMFLLWLHLATMLTTTSTHWTQRTSESQLDSSHFRMVYKICVPDDREDAE